MTESKTAPQIGVLAIQGDYEAHAAAVRQSGATASLVRDADGLANLDGLVMPGGESTTMLKFLDRNGFFEALQTFVVTKPTFGTCAGAILLAKDVRNRNKPEEAQRSLAALDITVERNAYGAQRDSAILNLETTLPEWQHFGPLETVFIRAPRIVQTGPEVEVLASREGFPVLVRRHREQGTIMAATFHPELSTDRRVHRLFVEAVIAAKK